MYHSDKYPFPLVCHLLPASTRLAAVSRTFEHWDTQDYTSVEMPNQNSFNFPGRRRKYAPMPSRLFQRHRLGFRGAFPVLAPIIANLSNDAGYDPVYAVLGLVVAAHPVAMMKYKKIRK